MNNRLAPVLAGWLAAGVPVARVVVERALGSTPREAGAAMLVTLEELCGTIGGGQLELDALAQGRALLSAGESSRRWDVALGPAIGQCCGGHVTLLAERANERMLAEIDASEQAPLPPVLLFGAGHVGRALARALALLPLRLRWIDARAEEFDASIGSSVEQIVSTAWEREIETAPAGSACIVMTHSHALDSLIVAAALEREDFAYVGLIGSKSKRRRFEHAFRDIGMTETQIARLVCPIGDRGIRDKRPEIIAALTAAELIEVFAERTMLMRPALAYVTRGAA
jgi:xanthine dehydrogenase accessory factor